MAPFVPPIACVAMSRMPPAIDRVLVTVPREGVPFCKSLLLMVSVPPLTLIVAVDESAARPVAEPIVIVPTPTVAVPDTVSTALALELAAGSGAQ